MGPRRLRIFNLSDEAYESCASPPTAATAPPTPACANEAELSSALSVSEGERIYDYCWYPLMDSDSPLSCAFISSCADHPIHMWDAYDASLRATYAGYNHLDEVTAAYSTIFDPTGSRIYAGYERTIRCFDVTRPGRECLTRSTCATRKSRDGQRGIISSLAFAPDGSGLFAAGSFAGTTGLYVENAPDAVGLLGGHCGGVTQVCAKAARLQTSTHSPSSVVSISRSVRGDVSYGNTNVNTHLISAYIGALFARRHLSLHRRAP